ncbi:23422_t:CDS:2 [Dentiscutata erythropus]|uniref:23422_t:CDS:1 n=1 Tax=Dentiscutata erythropus TaxID=1348616 RepID=A0A9N9NRB4_9GLOM|nr:23422_t:CDS:2 [Dentiscutata erythropus]
MQQPPMQQSMGMPVMNNGMILNPGQSVVSTGNVGMNDLQMQEAQKSQLLLQVLNLPQQTIDMLPPEQRNHVLALKQQLLLQTRQS